MRIYPLKCRIQARSGGPARIDVYDDIGDGDWPGGGTGSKEFAAQLAAIKGDIDVHVNSAGGDVFQGIAIASALSAHNGKVTTVVDGLAASIASVIAQAGSTRVMAPGSMMMIHDAFGAAVGNEAEMRAMADTLSKVSANIAGMYAERAGTGTAGSWRALMRAETWYTAAEAVEAGLADVIGGGEAVLPGGFDIAAFTAIPGRIAAQLRALAVTRRGGPPRRSPRGGTRRPRGGGPGQA